MAETMLAARFTESGKPLSLEQIPIPSPRAHEVLVRVAACGICLSDVHLIEGSVPPIVSPVTPGHEACGLIAKTGLMVSGWSEGERVVMTGGRYCGVCKRCGTGRYEDCIAWELLGFHYDGAWAEYVVAPALALSRVPDGIPSEQAAILADAVATPYAALLETGGLQVGESVGLWGVGGLGTHAVQLARLMGAATIVAVDPLDGARKRALDLGADVALDPGDEEFTARVMEATDGLGLDLALDLIGKNDAIKQGVMSLTRGGRCVVVGQSAERIELGPAVLFSTRATKLLGHLGYRKRHLDDLVGLVANGRLDLRGSITDIIPLTKVNEGVRRLREKDGDVIRIIVKP
ncbi:MAG: zinc-binding dehydrogenase [Actinomycetota bacterium]